MHTMNDGCKKYNCISLCLGKDLDTDKLSRHCDYFKPNRIKGTCIFLSHGIYCTCYEAEKFESNKEIENPKKKVTDIDEDEEKMNPVEELEELAKKHLMRNPVTGGDI